MALGTPVAAAAAYSAASGTTVTPAYPTGILTTDVVLLFVGQKPGTANGGTVTTPTGWTLREEITGAGGYGTTLSADTGNTNLRIYSWNSPVAGQTGNLSVTLGANNVSWAFILRVPSTRPTGSTITFGSADGQRTTTPTSPLSVALTDGTSATNFKAGDLAIWAMCIPTDVTTPAQFSAQGITAGAATFGTVLEINEPDSGNGNDIGGFSAFSSVTSGNTTSAPTITATLAGTLTNVRGPVALIRIRETAVLIGAPQTYDETLQPATLTVDRTLTASSDTFAFNGNDITLTKTTPAKILTADVATFTEDLKPANLNISRTLFCAVATYTVQGTETNFNRGVSLTADSQPYTFIGRDATLFPSRYLSLARTTFTITGPPASLIAIADTHTVTIDPPAGWALHLVTDVSQAGISACIYYNLSPAVAVGDQILYRTTTETSSNAVSVSSTGIVSTVPSGSDTLKFRHWRPSTWSVELTFTVGITARTLTADTQTYALDGKVTALPVKKIRYVNTASTTGGTGRTNATTGADRAYATLRSALETEQADLIAQNVKLEIYCAGGADSSTSSQQNWPSMVTGPNNDIKIYAAPGNEAEESFNSNKYHIARFTGGQEAINLGTTDNLYISYYNLQIKSTLTTHVAFRIGATTSGTTTGKVVVSGCYIEGGTTAYGTSFNSRNQPHVVVNSILVTTGGAASNTIASVFYNNTVISYSTAAAAAPQPGSTIPYYMRNNIFQNYGGGVALSGTLPTNTSSNITNDATSPEVGLRNITLIFRDKVGKNYRLISEDSAGIGSGTNLSADPIYPITVDLLGSTRTTWDIGAVKYVPLISLSSRIYLLNTSETSLTASRTLSCDSATYTEDLKPASLLTGQISISGGSVYRIKTEINGPALFTDTITQPNGTILGDTAEWDRWDTDNATQIISDGTDAAISQQNRDFAGVLVGNTSFGPDQWAEQVHSTGSSDRLGAGPIVRGSSGTTANGYVFRPISFGLPSDRFYIHRYINGVNTTIGDSGPQAVPILTTGTYTSRLEIIGNKLYGYINGKLVVTATDSSITSGQPGFQIFYSGGTTSFSAGQIEASTTGLKASRTLSCDPATYAEDLQPANFIVGRKLIAKVYADEQLFSDDFTGAAAVLGSNYTQQGDALLRLDGLGNVYNATSSARAIAWPNSVTFATNQYAEITLTQIASANSGNSGILLRTQTTEPIGIEKGYTFKTGDNGQAYTLKEYNESSTDILLASTTIIPKVGDRLRAVVFNNALYFYVNNQLIASASDTSWTTGIPAIYGFSNGWKSDNFVAGNYGGLHLAGTYTNTLAARTLSCDPATYTLELKDATLTKVSAKVLTADSQTYNEDLQPANLKAARTLLATTQTYNEDLQPANLRIAKRLVADSQIYTFTGRDASFSSAEVFGTISRQYTLSGNNVLFLRSVISSSVAYTFTGRDANLFRGERLTAESRAYNLTGRDATLNHAARVTADTSTFTLTGRDSNLLRGERLTADTSTYTFTGRDANLLRAERVTADVSSFALIGRDANLLRGERVTAESRAYNLTGRDATLNHAARVTADTRSYSLTRNEATLNHAARLTAEFSSYTLATNDANLSVTRKLVADSSSYALTGNNVLFVTTGSLNVTTATFTLTGNSANFARSRILVAATQPYNFVPNDAILKTSKKVIADKATYTLTGRAANLAAGEISTSDSQSFILTGNSVRFNRSVKSIVSSYTLTASDTNLKVGRKISLTVSSYITSGVAVNLLANKKISAVRVFFDTNGYVDPGYTDPNYVSIDIGMRAARKLAAQVTSFNLNGIAVNINRGGFIKVWTGSAWVSKPLKVWDGAAWVSKPLKIWDGTTWRIY